MKQELTKDEVYSIGSSRWVRPRKWKVIIWALLSLLALVPFTVPHGYYTDYIQSFYWWQIFGLIPLTSIIWFFVWFLRGMDKAGKEFQTKKAGWIEDV